MTNRPLCIPTSNVVSLPACVSGPFNVKSIDPMYRTVAGSVIAFANANAPVAVKYVPAPNVNAPVPSGPDVTVAPTVEGVLLAPIINPPDATFTPPPNVFAPLNAKIPSPDLTKPVVPLFVALLNTAEIANAATPALFNPFAALNSELPFTNNAPTSTVRVAPPKSTLPTPVLVMLGAVLFAALF
jgi:hypothetical protein